MAKYNDIIKNFTIAKTNNDKHYVFGWGQVAQTADGQTIEDWQKDVVEPEDLEEAAYHHVLNFRSTGERHDPEQRNKGKLIESCVFTKEKQAAIGIPEGMVPIGWWVGYYIDDPKAWEKIKSGEYEMFSVEGTGQREPIIAKSFSSTVQKYNAYHDAKGRFSAAHGATSFTFKPNTTVGAKAIAREKEKYKSISDVGVKEPKQRKPLPPKKTKETISKYVPAKTEKEAREFAKKELGFKYADYKGLNMESINHINKTIHEIQQKHPKFKGAVESIGTENASYFAAIHTSPTGTMDLRISTQKYAKGTAEVERLYKRDVKTGYHPNGTDYNSVLWHEYGHVHAVMETKKKTPPSDDILGFMNSRNSFETEEIWFKSVANKTNKNTRQLQGAISKYAQKDYGEAFAEAFGEVFSSKSPRSDSIEIVKASGMLE